MLETAENDRYRARVTVVRVLGLAVLLAGAASDAPARPITLRLTPFDVGPESDRNPCEYVELSNAEAVDVSRFEVRTPRNRLHHILLYAYLGDDRDPRHLTNGVPRYGDACAAIGPPDMAGHTLGLLGAVRHGVYPLP